MEGSCGQCLRARRVCTGYRDLTQLRIEDESQAVKRKAKARKLDMIPATLDVSIEDRARNAFFFNYVSGFSKTYDVLESLYSPIDGHLAASVDAVSLAFFAVQFHHLQVTQVARGKYSYALPLVSQVLRSPESAITDSTFLAVLFLDLFEKITNRGTQRSEAWMSHVNGALALVELRGSKNLATYPGTRLSVRLVTNIVVSCITASKKAPLGLIKLRTNLEPYLNTSDPKWQISGLVIKYANLRAAIHRNILSDIDIVRTATQIDYEYMSLAQTMPLSWSYETKHLDKPSKGVLEQSFDIYPDHFICQTWNVLRTTRILLNDLIRKYSSRDSSTFSEASLIDCQTEVSTITINSIAYDICASVPQYTRFQPVDPADTLAVGAHRIQCYILLYPLYVAGSFASPSTNIKEWVLEQLRYLSTKVGIRNSAEVAEYLEIAPDTDPWKIHSLLGSYAFAA